MKKHQGQRGKERNTQGNVRGTERGKEGQGAEHQDCQRTAGTGSSTDMKIYC